MVDYGSAEHKTQWIEMWASCFDTQDEAEAEWANKLRLDERPHTDGHYVMNDIQPYKSQIDGHMVMSRSDHRAHLRANGCIEIGNEVQKFRPMTPPSGLKETLISVANEKLRS